MKSYCISLILSVIFMPLAAQINTDLAPFEHIKIMGFFDVELIVGEEERIEIKAHDFDIDRIKISQQGGTLKLSTLRSIVEDADIDVKIYYQSLSSLSVGGGAKVESDQPLVGSDLYIRAGSGSEIYLEIEAGELEAQASEGAHLTLRGKVEILDAGANTGGILDGHRLVAQSAKMRAGTGGEASATVEQSLDAKANTGGVIRYAGSPPETNSRTILGGEVHPLRKR
ncbi:MAG: head GIN domain-containing protein [Bacteroidota bacterium]